LLPHQGVGTHFRRSERGFSLLELLLVVAIIGVLAGVAIGITPGIINVAKGEAGAQQLEGFLRRTRELAISRRRNIRIRFIAPNSVESAQIAVPGVPGPAFTVIETLVLEGSVEFRQFAGLPDTPDLFGMAAPVTVGGVDFAAFPSLPIMFTSEGVFADANSFPANASIFLGRANRPDSANAITVLGATAALRTFRWDGARWVR
jgi:prepilin-type N-terminal cleavage/methylation domain-containing protein